MNIGQRVRKVRELKNYTQEFMAEQLKISQSHYCRMEADKSKIGKKKRLREISETLGN